MIGAGCKDGIDAVRKFGLTLILSADIVSSIPELKL